MLVHYVGVDSLSANSAEVTAMTHLLLKVLEWKHRGDEITDLADVGWRVGQSSVRFKPGGNCPRSRGLREVLHFSSVVITQRGDHPRPRDLRGVRRLLFVRFKPGVGRPRPRGLLGVLHFCVRGTCTGGGTAPCRVASEEAYASRGARGRPPLPRSPAHRSAVK